MSDTATLKIEQRSPMTKGEMKALRRSGYVPASISPKGAEALSFSVKKEDLTRALSSHGLTGVYKLQMGRKKPLFAMLREIQTEPLTRTWLHVTFDSVRMDEETKAELPIVLHGKETLQHNGFAFVQSLEHLAVRGLPGDFPHSIEVDVAELEPGATLTVADLKLPEGVAAEVEGDRLVFSVSHPRTVEEESTEVEAPADAEATEEAPAEENAE